MPIIQVNQISSQTGGVLTVGQSGDTVTLASGATSSGFGATYTGVASWSTTVRTTGFTAVSGNGYFCNTTSGAFTVTLPASPSAGSVVAIADYAGTAATNNITIARNGSNYEGGTLNGIINVNRDALTLIYVDSTQGWIPVSDNTLTSVTPQYISATGGTIVTCGNYKIHTFTSTGCFVVSSAGNAAGANTVEYLVVGGGGPGGGGGPPGVAGGGSGGGGGGGFRQNYPSPVTAGLPVTATTYPITVGAGGSPSVFSTITSAAGGSGAPGGGGTAGSGGSGGGGSGVPGTPAPAGGTAGGAGNTPPVSPPQGQPGAPGGNYNRLGSGGGGAGAAGAVQGPGGIGQYSFITGVPQAFSGGGGYGGAGQEGYPGGGAGGQPYTTTGPSYVLFGAGLGTGLNYGAVGGSGSANTGGGAGGGGSWCGAPGGHAGGTGGSGVVVIRYKYQ